MREPVQEPPLIHMRNLKDNISITPTARRSHNILIKRKRYKDDDGEEIDGSANSAHALRNLHTIQLAHVAAAKASPHECRAQPSDHSIAEGEGDER